MSVPDPVTTGVGLAATLQVAAQAQDFIAATSGHPGESIGEILVNLVLTCDDSDEHAVECLNAFKGLKGMHPSVEGKIPMISLGDDRFNPPLQASDLFAYCYRQERAI